MISGYTIEQTAMKNYQYLDHTADLGIEVYGQTLEALFMNIGIAIFETQLSGEIIEDEKLDITLSDESLEELFIDWCRDLLYNFSVHGFIPKTYKISIENFTLNAQLHGDRLDLKQHTIKTEINNVTYHDFRIGKVNDHYQATVIFDV
jgi:SHS2 domain-containing protein